MNKRVHLIACGVLSLDFQALIEELGVDISTEYLPGGLHETPLLLREKLQEAIDRVSREGKADYIALGYGVCGRGTVGLKARAVPLLIPKVHDCIALFLGSDKEYRKQFADCPGTYYISAGWVNEKVTPQQLCKTCQLSADERVDFSYMVELYGKDDAEHIQDFFSSWQKNYSRAAFIDTGIEQKNKRYAQLAQNMADDLGWRYERLAGTHHLLKTLLTTRLTSDEILLVPANYMTVWDAVGNGLAASTVCKEAEDMLDNVLYLAEDGSRVTEQIYLEGLEERSERAELGIGIDAGGTYTDVVLYDFVQQRVLKKAKAATTKWDFTIGINAAIEALELEDPAKIDLVNLSTTMATNSIVEGRGQKVGLLIMPPYGIYHPGDIAYEPLAVISGRLDINGKEVEPVDAAEVERIAREMITQHRVEAFAVTGFASINNSAHELRVKEILCRELGCSVTCGHEISADLNYRVRSITSVLNARIIPCLEKLLEDMMRSLKAQGIVAQQMVVRSDGSLMNVQTALQKPIETILSGPASSAKGASFLAGIDDGLIVDIGGTTTDTAIVQQGRVVTNADGACVGGYRTHIKTLDLRTVGLGGDSNIIREKSVVKIGPKRVLPLCRAVEMDPAISRCLAWAEGNKDKFVADSYGMEILFLTGKDTAGIVDWSEDEQKIIGILQERPQALDQLAKKLDKFSAKYLPLTRLEEGYYVQRTGFTPTDLLHVVGKVGFADMQAAQTITGIYADIAGKPLREYAEDLLLEVRKILALEMIKRELASSVEVETMGESMLIRHLLENLYAEGNANYKVGFKLRHPVIGIGAPTAELLIPANDWLETECIIPPHAEVANAVGAIISPVHIERELRIEPGDDGEYVLQGVSGSLSFTEFSVAHDRAVVELHRKVLEAALAAGTAAGLVINFVAG